MMTTLVSSTPMSFDWIVLKQILDILSFINISVYIAKSKDIYKTKP